MFWRWIVPAVVAAIVFIKAEIIAAAGGAEELSWLARRFQLADVFKDGKGHGRGGDWAVVAGICPVATAFRGLNTLFSIALRVLIVSSASGLAAYGQLVYGVSSRHS